ncbi:hypothetical protein L873DRAFT_1837275 [Choiromyces venosus 120613-1]|uniref:Uncharacterized protein n=1 Tax=Choiromyces venosus 120613-1 TaxID=1336337 RepID=A0A3N4JDN8_9PEZI|nr:hypothetical protein L873DRAFT_1837275 [Choiromyces venosus 120613-1]
MCQYELWLYSKSKCPKSPHCSPPTPRADMMSTSELPIQRRDRYCTTCFETLKSAMGGVGDSCWPCGEEHWVDRRLLTAGATASGGGSNSAKALVDLEGWNGMDSSVEVEGRSRQARLKFLARNWKGWREWGAGASTAALGVSGGGFRGIA